MKSKLFKNLALSLASLVVSLLIAEGMIRFAASQELLEVDESLPLDNNLYSASRIYKYAPYTSTVFRLGEFQSLYGINKYGFRDGDYSQSKPRNTRRIIVLGDSMSMGAGVDLAESYSKALESKLNKSGSDLPIDEVMNMAINGYGPINYLGVLKEEAIKFEPDIVIVGAYMGNDARDTLSQIINQKYITLRALPDETIPYSINQKLKENSKLWLFLLTKYYSWVQSYDINTKEVMFEDKYYEKAFYETHIEQSEDIKRSWLAIKDIYKEIDQLGKDNGFNVIFLGIPARHEILKDEWKVLKEEGYKVDNRLYTNPYSRAQFLNICETEDFSCLDLQTPLRSHRSAEELFLGTDNHFSVIGHKVVADEILKYLRHQNLVE